MAQGVGDLRLPFPARDLTLRVLLSPRDLTPEERELARAAERVLRVGLEQGSSEFVAVARELERALSGVIVRFDRRGSRDRSTDSSLAFRLFTADLARRLATELSRGRILVLRSKPVPLGERADALLPELPPLPPPGAPGLETSFEVRFVDETGQAINGLPVELDAGGVQDLSTNAAGIALVESVTSTTGSVVVPDQKALDAIVDPRWVKPRRGTPPTEANSVDREFVGGPLEAVALKAAVPNRVVVKPPRGVLFAELRDKTGHRVHAEQDYTIDGPETFSATTDEFGVLIHENVFPGDYTLKLTVKTELGDETRSDDFESPLVVLSAGAVTPQVRRVGALRRVVMGRMSGPMYETNKSFLLPSAIDRLGRMQLVYAENSPGELLIVGHTDTEGQPSLNDPLSLERADNMAAFLKDDVDAWLKMYGTGIPEGRRWGKREDALMLASLADFEERPPAEDAVRWFQRTRGLSVDGIAGPVTRRELVLEYMDLDAALLSDELFEIRVTTHGCGENFPVDEGGEIDAAPADEKEDSGDRRVELFFFDAEFGIFPAPPGKNSSPGSTQYPAWRKSVQEEFEVGADVAAPICELDLELATADGKLLAKRLCKVHLGERVAELTTDDAGKLFVDLIPPDDYLIEVGSDFKQFVTALEVGLGHTEDLIADLPTDPS